MRELDEDAAESGRGLQKALDALRRRRWPMLVVFLVVVTAFGSTVTFLPDVYQATATVLIERQQIPDELVRSTVTSALEVRLQTISQEILSRTRLQELVQRLGLYTDERKSAPIETVLERVRDDISIQLKRGDTRRRGDTATVAFTVSFVARDPQKAALVANTLTSYFVEANLKERERVATGTADFLRAQLRDAREKLDELEQKVSDFKQAHMGSLPEQLSANLATLEQLSSRLRVNSDRQSQNRERRAALENQLAELMGTADAPQTPDERLMKLREQLTALRTRYSDKHPDVVRVTAEIAALERMIREAPQVGGTLVAPASPQAVEIQRQLREVDVEGRTLTDEAANLKQAIAQYQGRVEVTPSREQEFASLSREYDTAQELYTSLVKRAREAELAENMEERQKGEQFRVLDPARPPQEPTAPKRSRLLLLGLVLALGLGFGVGLALEVLDASLHDAEDLKALTSIPVIVTIPSIVTPAQRRARTRRMVWGTTLTLAGLVFIVGISFVLVHQNSRLLTPLLH
jgi:succinoglycan biosynthesis transport protein ExoP